MTVAQVIALLGAIATFLTSLVAAYHAFGAKKAAQEAAAVPPPVSPAVPPSSPAPPR